MKALSFTVAVLALSASVEFGGIAKGGSGPPYGGTRSTSSNFSQRPMGSTRSATTTYGGQRFGGGSLYPSAKPSIQPGRSAISNMAWRLGRSSHR